MNGPIVSLSCSFSLETLCLSSDHLIIKEARKLEPEETQTCYSELCKVFTTTPHTRRTLVWSFVVIVVVVFNSIPIVLNLLSQGYDTFFIHVKSGVHFQSLMRTPPCLRNGVWHTVNQDFHHLQQITKLSETTGILFPTWAEQKGRDNIKLWGGWQLSSQVASVLSKPQQCDQVRTPHPTPMHSQLNGVFQSLF